MSETERTLDADSRKLKELGYDQELERSWGQFTNFAISFSIISILAGCFTTYGQAWNNGGPIAISWGWPIISAFILIIGFCMSEILSAFPTAGAKARPRTGRRSRWSRPRPLAFAGLAR